MMPIEVLRFTCQRLSDLRSAYGKLCHFDLTSASLTQRNEYITQRVALLAKIKEYEQFLRFARQQDGITTNDFDEEIC